MVASSLLISLREGVLLAPGDSGEIVFQGEDSRVVLRQPLPGTFAELADAAATEDRLARQALEAGGIDGLSQFYYHLRQLVARGFLVRSSHAEGEPLATLIPLTPSFRGAVPEELPPGRRFVLSRFAFLRGEGGYVFLESPRSHARVVLHDWRATALVHALAQPSDPRSLSELIPGLSCVAVDRTVALLLAAGMLSEVDEGAACEEEIVGSLRSWEFHDLLFHARSRQGRTDLPYGATFALGPAAVPPPCAKPVTTAETIALHRPDLGRLQAEDAPLARVMEQRRSIREYGDAPLTDRQLGEFLYRVARIKQCRSVVQDTPWGPQDLELTSRPYPAGGALYELELYAVVRACANIAPGLYRYDALQHRLARVSGTTPEVEELLREGAVCAGLDAPALQVMLIMSARFERLRWKYSGLAYALILKHVGIVQQSMYLAATAMNLAPCALGGGDSDLFARAIGGDYYAETSVGEFLLGSVADSTPG